MGFRKTYEELRKLTCDLDTSDERKQARDMWEAVRAGCIYHELTSSDKLEYRRRKGVHETQLKEIRERRRLLLNNMKTIKSEWQEHYDDIRKKKEAIEKALDGATEAGFRSDNLSHFFQ